MLKFRLQAPTALEVVELEAELAKIAKEQAEMDSMGSLSTLS